MKLLILIIFIALTACAHSPRPWTKAEKVLLVTSTLAATADYYTSKAILDKGGYEQNLILGKHHSKTKFAAYMITSQTLAVIISHYVPCLRKPLLGLKTVVNTGLAIDNDKQ